MTMQERSVEKYTLLEISIGEMAILLHSLLTLQAESVREAIEAAREGLETAGWL
jgi:hypothetical protein